MLKWIISFFASFIFAWCVSFFFTDSLSLKVFDNKADRFVLKQDNQVRKRSEGWANTLPGPHGITGLYKGEYKRNPIIAIWGDSYIEGFQVEDQEKAGSIITLECQEKCECDYVGFNIGMAGQSIADYYFAIPNYEKIFETISSHYIVFSGFVDVLPENESAHLSQFVSSPYFAFKKKGYETTTPWLKSIIYEFKLDFVWYLTKNILSNKVYRFVPVLGKNESHNSRGDQNQISYNRGEAWDFLLSSMKKLTDKPICFVYCPLVPVLKDNKIIFEDSQQEMATEFENICKKKHVQFINLQKDFVRFYQRTGRFPRGFFNSPPSLGHLNADGHRLLGLAILRHALTEKE